MKGFIIKTKLAGESDVLEVAVPDGSVNISIEMTRYWATVGIGGLKFPEDMHISFIGGDLQLGDEIYVEFADVEKSPLPIWQETHCSLVERMVTVSQKDDDEEILKRKLEQYYRLKAILEAEELIE